ncbi:hypothetical protein SERLA73DRAFT_141868, partial [Serpula lacrymans var. lacrymans S7.3]
MVDRKKLWILRTDQSGTPHLTQMAVSTVWRFEAWIATPERWTDERWTTAWSNLQCGHTSRPAISIMLHTHTGAWMFVMVPSMH